MKVRCQKCRKAKMTSCVYPVHIVSYTYTIMNYGEVNQFWDEDGEEHNHNNTNEEHQYRCSNGHEWRVKIRHDCWCGWRQEFYEWRTPDGNKALYYRQDSTDGPVLVQDKNGNWVKGVYYKLTNKDLIKWIEPSTELTLSNGTSTITYTF